MSQMPATRHLANCSNLNVNCTEQNKCQVLDQRKTHPWESATYLHSSTNKLKLTEKSTVVAVCLAMWLSLLTGWPGPSGQSTLGILSRDASSWPIKARVYITWRLTDGRLSNLANGRAESGSNKCFGGLDQVLCNMMSSSSQDIRF